MRFPPLVTAACACVILLSGCSTARPACVSNPCVTPSLTVPAGLMRRMPALPPLPARWKPLTERSAPG